MSFVLDQVITYWSKGEDDGYGGNTWNPGELSMARLASVSMLEIQTKNRIQAKEGSILGNSTRIYSSVELLPGWCFIKGDYSESVEPPQEAITIMLSKSIMFLGLFYAEG